MSQDAQDIFFKNGFYDFLQLPLLLSTLNYIDHVSNVKNIILIQSELLGGSILENCLHHSGDIKYPRKLILIWDMGASYGLTPFRRDFIGNLKCNIPVKDLTGINRYIGIGATLYKFINSNVKEIFLPCVSYNFTQNYF